MARMSYREYQIRLAWMDQEWNEPDRSDHYLMLIVRYLDAIMRRSGKLKELLSFKIPFTRKKQELTTKTQEPNQAPNHWDATLGAMANGKRSRSRTPRRPPRR